MTERRTPPIRNVATVRRGDGAEGEVVGRSTDADGEPPLSVDDLFTPHDFGRWPEGFLCNREEMYD
ncbi:MAG: hypothetical protein F4151_03080 [Gammaproteobacteria bacterium]|nr:hypothetical protein [Gammaproteobacteria bacterium]MYL05519.1 hypothetical protein [Gemmatimonadales bacterium]